MPVSWNAAVQLQYEGKTSHMCMCTFLLISKLCVVFKIDASPPNSRVHVFSPWRALEDLLFGSCSAKAPRDQLLCL